MTQRIGGFYQLAASPEARMTHLVGSGAGNSTDRLWVGNDALSLSQISANPFKGVGSASSDRAWDGPTFPLSISGARRRVRHESRSRFQIRRTTACRGSRSLTGAIVSRTQTRTRGLLNQWETDGRYQKVTYNAAGNVTNAVFGKCPQGTFASDPANCVDFPKMGALPLRKDIFIEFGYMRALAGTTYGITSPKGGAAHDHRPDPEALQKVGRAFDNAPVTIKVHFDLGDDYPSRYRRRTVPHSGHADGGFGARRRGCRRNSVRSDGKSGDVRVLGVSGHGALEDRISIPQR